jgi:hypothetical protein
VFYLLWGPVGPLENLWQVSRAGERQLTHNPRGYEIDSSAASKAGIIVSDALHDEDLLARWTRHGPQWMRPWRGHGRYMHAAVWDMTADGQILYTPLSEAVGAPIPIVLEESFSGPVRVIYRQPGFAARAFFGPGGKIALIGSARILIRSPRGALQRLRTGLGTLGRIAWGTQAAALAVAPQSGATRIIFPSGRQEALPAGWLPLSWSPDGTRLLVMSDTTLGVWAPSTARISVIGPVNRATQVWQAKWLSAPAHL